MVMSEDCGREVTSSLDIWFPWQQEKAPEICPIESEVAHSSTLILKTKPKAQTLLNHLWTKICIFSYQWS